MLKKNERLVSVFILNQAAFKVRLNETSLIGMTEVMVSWIEMMVDMREMMLSKTDDAD